jgi:hypothetical protein
VTGDEFLATLPEQPGPDRDAAILEAVRSGIAGCAWTPILSEQRGRRATLYVSDDAVRVVHDGDKRFRLPMSATLAQQCADLMGASLCTSYVMDLSYAKADWCLPAFPQKADAFMATTGASRRYNDAVESARQHRTGLIRDCGKTWVLSPLLRQRPDVACNYGFFHPQAPYSSHSGEKMFQTRGTRHSRTHVDYSQVGIFVKQEMVIDGEPARFSDVLANRDLFHLVSDEGYSSIVRQPGVPLEAVPDVDASKSLGDRLADWMIQEQGNGVREDPPGSNTGPRIKQYLAGLERRATGQPLGLTAANWCSAMVGFGLRQVARPGEAYPTPRAAGIELEEGAMASGDWHNVTEAISGTFVPRRGDIVICTRPGSGWERHVCVLLERVGDTITTVGGNENHSVQVSKRNLKQGILGFIEVGR